MFIYVFKEGDSSYRNNNEKVFVEFQDPDPRKGIYINEKLAGSSNNENNQENGVFSDDYIEKAEEIAKEVDEKINRILFSENPVKKKWDKEAEELKKEGFTRYEQRHIPPLPGYNEGRWRKWVGAAIAGGTLFLGGALWDYSHGPVIKEANYNEKTKDLVVVAQDGALFLKDNIKGIYANFYDAHGKLLERVPLPASDGAYDSPCETAYVNLKDVVKKLEKEGVTKYTIKIVAEDAAGHKGSKVIGPYEIKVGKIKPPEGVIEVKAYADYDPSNQLLTVEAELPFEPEKIWIEIKDEKGNLVHHEEGKENENYRKENGTIEFGLPVNLDEIVVDKHFNKPFMSIDEIYEKALQEFKPGETYMVEVHATAPSGEEAEGNASFGMKDVPVVKLEVRYDGGGNFTPIRAVLGSWFSLEGNATAKIYGRANESALLEEEVKKVLEKEENAVPLNTSTFLVANGKLNPIEVEFYKLSSKYDSWPKDAGKLNFTSVADAYEAVLKAKELADVNESKLPYYSIAEGKVKLKKGDGKEAEARIFVLNYGKSEEDAATKLVDSGKSKKRLYLDDWTALLMRTGEAGQQTNLTALKEISISDIVWKEVKSGNVSECLEQSTTLKADVKAGKLRLAEIPGKIKQYICSLANWLPGGKANETGSYGVVVDLSVDEEGGAEAEELNKTPSEPEKYFLDFMVNASRNGESVGIYAIKGANTIVAISTDPNFIDEATVRERCSRLYAGDRQAILDVSCGGGGGGGTKPPSGGGFGGGGSDHGGGNLLG